RYKGQTIDPRQVGKDLKVRAVLTGQVTARAGKLSFTVELFDTLDGRQLWRTQAERPLTELTAVQTELAQQVATHLHRQLSGVERQRLSRAPTDNAEAYQLYLKGRYLLEQYNEASFRRAIELFQQALSLDSGFAAAYAGLARGYYEMSDLYLPAAEMMPKARAAAERALEFDANLSEAYLALALVKAHYDWDDQAAFRLFERALELNPNSAATYHQYGLVLMIEGRSAEALAALQRARELDPLSTSIAVTAILPYYQAPPAARRYDLAITEVRNILALDPKFLHGHLLLGGLLIQKGQYEEALAEFKQGLQLENDWTGLSFLAHVYGKMGQTAEANKILNQLLAQSNQQHISALSPAIIYAGLGDKEQTLFWLEKACANREQNVRVANVDPLFDFLRSDPRFTDLLRRLKVVP
ncbi:MAG TPA: tetratricopeptide repeat protein, partial [Blastocatellia bacterium]|nr:tetratricopeptide repeat protein [Blastocatellia bacterium]